MSERILIVGDSMLDVAYRGTSSRNCPEAPVPILADCELTYAAGGAANVARNVAAMGGAVKFISCSGAEIGSGQMLRQKCVSLDTTWVFSRKTTQKTRFFSGGRMLLRMDHDYVCQDDEARLVYEQVCRELPHASLLVLSDYAKGALAKTQLMITQAKKFNVPVLVDPKGDDWSRYYGANWIKANESEAIAAAKFHNCFPNFSMLPGNLYLDGLVVTRANRAPTIHTQEAVPWTAPHIFPKKVIDVTGGGDSYVAAMAVCLAEGAPLAHALDFAAKAGAIAVSHAGTYVVTKEDIANVSSI